MSSAAPPPGDAESLPWTQNCKSKKHTRAGGTGPPESPLGRKEGGGTTARSAKIRETPLRLLGASGVFIFGVRAHVKVGAHPAQQLVGPPGPLKPLNPLVPQTTGLKLAGVNATDQAENSREWRPSRALGAELEAPQQPSVMTPATDQMTRQAHMCLRIQVTGCLGRAGSGSSRARPVGTRLVWLSPHGRAMFCGGSVHLLE